MKILVTGIAGDIGNSIGRILRDSSFTTQLIGCDIHDEHMGRYIFDSCETVPRATSPNYINTIKTLVDREGLDAVIVTSEPELRFLSALQSNQSVQCMPLIMANRRSMQIGFDKLKTINFIEDQGVSAPWTLLADDGVMPPSFPCIFKSRFGAGSQGVYLVKDQSLAVQYQALFPDFIWQEYLPNDDNEYTCGVYGCNDGEVRTIIFRRRLVSGVTGYAELVENAEIESLCIKLAKALELRGSINIQLRLSLNGPMVFEINPRFSSTVGFRHKMGFKDVLWSLEESILGQKSTYNNSFPVGTKIYRSSNELILSP